MRAMMIALGAALAVGGIAGWLTAGGGVNASRAGDVDWTLSPPPNLGAVAQSELLSALMATQQFGVAQDSTSGASENGDDDDLLPQIASASIIDGKIAVGFHGIEGIVAAGIGDSLPGGWVVMDATLERVIIERDGDAREIAVFPYDNTGS